MSTGSLGGVLSFTPENHILKQSEELESAGAYPADESLQRKRARLPIFAHDLNQLHEPVNPRTGCAKKTNASFRPLGGHAPPGGFFLPRAGAASAEAALR